jgi:hypothetical protein
MLHVGTGDSTSAPWGGNDIVRVTNLLPDVIADPENLWDIMLDESVANGVCQYADGTPGRVDESGSVVSERCEENQITTYTVSTNDQARYGGALEDVGSDGGGRLNDRASVHGCGTMWTNTNREGIIMSNAGDKPSDCAGTGGDTVFWGWYAADGECPTYGCSTNMHVGTPCNCDDPAADPMKRYNLLFMR